MWFDLFYDFIGGKCDIRFEKPGNVSNVVIECETIKEMESVINSVENQDIVMCNEQGYIIDSEKLEEVCDDINISTLQAYYNENGLGSISKEDIYDSMIKGIESVNNQIADGELEVLDEGTIVDATDDSYYLQGGSTYDVTHWWGKTRYKSTADAKKWAHTLNKVAAGECGAAAVSAVFGVVPVVVGGLGSAYCWNLGEDVAYYNGKSNRGIKVEMTWCLVYSISVQ